MEYKKLLTFSFDDGVTQDIRFIEILNKYGLKCTFNLNSELLGMSGELEVNGEKVSHNKVNKNDVRKIYQGHEIAAHTLTHPFLPNESFNEVTRQVEEDRLKLSEIAGYEVVGFAYPGGGVNHTAEIADVIKNTTGVKYARTIKSTFSFDTSENLYLLNPTISLTKNSDVIEGLTEKFLDSENDKISLFYIWGHSYELDAGNRWSYFEEVCKKISGRKDVYYCTNREAFEYIDKMGNS